MSIEVIDMTRREPCECPSCTMERHLEDLPDDAVESLLLTLASEIDPESIYTAQGWPVTNRRNLLLLLAQADEVVRSAEALGYDRTQERATVRQFYEDNPEAREKLRAAQREAQEQGL